MYENVKKFCKVLKLKTLGDLNRIYNIKIPQSFVKFLKKDLRFFKNYLNKTKENAIAQVLFQLVSKDLKASVQSHYQQMQKLLKFLKKQ